MNAKKLQQCTIVFLLFLLTHLVSLGQTQVKQEGKINYTSFTINATQKRILIDWGTDNKVPTNYFEIERSLDGVNFKTIALVLGQDPKQEGCDCYEGFDKPDTRSKKYFYRLKHVGLDGEIELSETKMLALNK
jgi:hypothetical protein